MDKSFMEKIDEIRKCKQTQSITYAQLFFNETIQEHFFFFRIEIQIGKV